MRIRHLRARLLVGAVFVVLSIYTFAQNRANQGGNNDLGFTDTPMLPGLPYHVHDPGRPAAPVVSPAVEPGGPPSDAIVLFGGKDLSAWESGERWKVSNGFFEIVPGTGNLKTKARFGDCQLHIEWA